MDATVNLCEHLSAKNINPVASWVIDVWFTNIPKSDLHPCPYNVNIFVLHVTLLYRFVLQGMLNLNNLTVDNKIMKMLLPDGYYKLNLKFWSSYDPEYITVAAIFEISGSRRKEFWATENLIVHNDFY